MLQQCRPVQRPHRQKDLSTFHFEIVKGYQLSCLGCPISGLQPKVERIPVDLFDSCLRNVDVDFVGTLRLFNFGEPLMHDDLPGTASKIPLQSWSVEDVEISTNAQYADWLQLEDVIKVGVVTRVVVSCDGDLTPESYEALRPPSKWDKLIEFVRRMRQLRDRHDPTIELMTRTIVPEWRLRHHWVDLLHPLGWTLEFRHFFYLSDSSQNMTDRELQPGKGVCFFCRQRRPAVRRFGRSRRSLLCSSTSGSIRKSERSDFQ